MKFKRKYESVVVKLKKYLERLKFSGDKKTNTELAKYFSVSNTTIGNWIHGHKPMSPKKCIELAEGIKEKPEVILITMLRNNESDLETKDKLQKILDRL
jgi:hypothetical protein